MLLAIQFFNGGKAVRQIDTDSISAVTFDPTYSKTEGYGPRLRIKADKDYDLFFPAEGDCPGDAVKMARVVWTQSAQMAMKIIGWPTAREAMAIRDTEPNDDSDSGWTDDPDALFNFLVKGKFNL